MLTETIVDAIVSRKRGHMSEVGAEIIKTEETRESGIKYLNINVSNSEVERDPDVVRLCADARILEYAKSKIGYCKDCKWWKDSDGAYRRGIYAESKCPINRKEVFEGNGYCYMFEPQEGSRA